MTELIERARHMLGENPGGIIPAEHVADLCGDMPVAAAMTELVPLAAEYAQPAISGYKVGAVGLGASGAIILGANIEFAGAPLAQTVHAEQCLVANAAASGERGLQRLAISAAPCGHCRQFLHELDGSEPLLIAIPGQGDAGLDTLLPHAFGPQDLGLSGGLLQPRDNGLVMPDGLDELQGRAAKAANGSYAPYSQAPAGAAIRFTDGTIFSGSYLENAAFNPGLPALQAAFSCAVMAGRNPLDVQRLAIAQSDGASIDHVAAITDFVRRLAAHVTIEAVQLNPTAST